MDEQRHDGTSLAARHVTSRWNGGRRNEGPRTLPIPRPEPTFESSETLPWAIATWAEREPDRSFLHDVGGAARSYGELHEAALHWADAFRRTGIERGDNVPAMVPMSISSIEHWLGLGWAGAVHTGVNTEFRGRSLEYVLNNCRATRMICAREYLVAVAEIAPELERLELVIVADADAAQLPEDFPLRLTTASELWDAAQPARDLSVPQRHEIACITYTSGTTGPSKGVLIPWGRLWPDDIWADATSDDVYYCPFPIFHVAGMLPLAWMGFPGGQVVLRESFKTSHFWEDVRKFGCTMTALIPAMINWLLDQPPRADDVDNPLRHAAGAPVVARIEEFKSRFGVRFRTTFGTTEAGAPLYAGPDVSADRASSGKWVASGYQVRVADENDYEVPVGEIGELLVRTTEPWRMMAGYFGMSDKTAAAWRNGWFHTGDAVVRDESGRYHFVDRINDSIRRRGENISSMEVEAYVNEHPAVSESAVIGVPSEYGEDEVKVCVVLHDDQTVSHAELHDFLAARMPTFMVPRYIEFLEKPERTEAMKRVKKAPLRVDPLNDRTWDARGRRVSSPAPDVAVLHRTPGGLLEAPTFDRFLGLVFADARLGGVHSLTPSTGVETLVAHRRGIGGLALHEAGGFVVTGRNVAHKRRDVDGTPSPTTVLLTADALPHAVGFNDLTVDEQGRVYVGSLTELAVADPRRARGGEFILVDTDGSWRVVAEHIWAPNGTDRSPDGAALYLVDSGRRMVFRFDVDLETGSLHHQRILIEVDTGVPDGMAVARDGSIWLAHAYAGFVRRYAPDGTPIATWPVPQPFVTSLCFGGAENRQLFITTGADPPEAEAAIYTVEADVPGVDVPAARVLVDRARSSGG